MSAMSMHSVAAVRNSGYVAMLRPRLLASLLLAAVASGPAHASQAGSSFNVSVNYIAGGSGSCGLVSSASGIRYVACANVPVTSTGLFSAQVPQDSSQTGSDFAIHVGPYRLHGALKVFAPATYIETRRVAWNGRDYLEMTLGW